MKIDLNIVSNKIADLDIIEQEMLQEIMQGSGLFNHDIGYIQGKKEALLDILKGYYESISE